MLKDLLLLIGTILLYIVVPLIILLIDSYIFGHKTPVIVHNNSDRIKEGPIHLNYIKDSIEVPITFYSPFKSDGIKLTFDYKTFYVLKDGKYLGKMNDNIYLITLKGFKSEIERLADKLSMEPEFTILGEDNISYLERDLDRKQKTLDLINERFRELNEFRKN